MEKFDTNFQSVESYAKTLVDEINTNRSIDELFDNYSNSLLSNEAFESNFPQLIKMASMVAEPGVKNEKAVNTFLMGEVLAYSILHKKYGDDVYDNVREALNNLYSHARIIVNQEVFDEPEHAGDDARHRMIGLYINHIMDDDLSFDSIPTDEMHIVSYIISEITSSDDYLYDGIRGYSLIRSSLIWNERYQIEMKKEDLRSNDDSLSEMRQFYEIMSEVEVDPHLADGHISVQSSIVSIYKKYEELLQSVTQDLEEYDQEKYDDVKDEIINSLAPEIVSTPDLVVLDTVYIDGTNIVIICDSEGDIVQMVPLGKELQIQGQLLDYDINPVPKSDWLETMHAKLAKKTKTRSGVPFDPFGLVMLLGEAQLVNTETGQTFGIKDELFVYVPVGYESTTVYKVMVPEDYEYEYDSEDDEYDEDD